jgi:gliding motility-associated-like protein
LANPVTTTIDTVVCFGDFFFYPGSGTNLPPNTVDTFLYQTSTLADSFVIVTVTGLDTFNITIDTSACFGSTLFFAGQSILVLQTNSVFTFNLQSISGCDSTLTVNVSGLDTLRYTIDTSICQNSTLNFGGQILLPNTSTNFNLPALNACDTILTVNVTGLDVFSSAISSTICHGDSFAYAGQFLGANTTTVFNLQTVNGCDSIISLTVLGLDTFYTIIDTTVVNGGTILFAAQTFLPNTTTTFNLQTAGGCDSIIIVIVTEIEVSVFEGIPDIFSPNGDGVNDLFFPIGLNQEDVVRFRVFNRWSQEIYIGDNLENAGWDGRFQGVEQASEVYMFLLEYDLGDGAGPQIIKGNFTLIR